MEPKQNKAKNKLQPGQKSMSKKSITSLHPKRRNSLVALVYKKEKLVQVR